ncbi:RDD family protein [Actinacidiphila glaucinigra]|uniref:RDD family protein n=1 Tax=Actinacidiphila glaucinigra TaxID=235986 RepID=UPI0033B93DDE
MNRQQVSPAAGAGEARKRIEQGDPRKAVRPAGSTTVYAPDGDTVAVQPGETALSLAGPGRRVVAKAIDFAVFLIIETVLMYLLGAVADLEGGAYFLPLILVSVAWWSAYGAVQLHLWGCTLGKRAAGLRVYRVWEGTTLPTWRQAWLREGPASLIYVIPGLNVLAGLARIVKLYKNRPYHHSQVDFAPGTVVIHHLG